MTTDQRKDSEMTRPDEFILEEYKSLRRETEALQSEARLVAQIALGGGLAIYAWLAKNPDPDIARIGWWTPVPIPVFVLVHFVDHIYKVDRISKYIRQYIEVGYIRNYPRVELSEYQGWECYLCHERSRPNKILAAFWDWLKQSSGSTVYVVFWVVLFFVTSAIAIAYS